MQDFMVGWSLVQIDRDQIPKTDQLLSGVCEYIQIPRA